MPFALDLFGIIPVDLRDVVEIALVAYVLYRLYQLMRGTIAVQIFIGIGALYLIQVAVRILDMTMLKAIFESVSDVFVVAIIVLFAPEIRRLLLILGQNPLVRRIVSTGAEQEEVVAETVEAVERMSEHRIGALIVFQRTTGLRSYIETGEQLQAQLTRDLLITIFHGQNPLHDGAAIIQNRRLEAARCILPVSTSMQLSPHLGLRHRAAVGLTEQTDAFVVIVSEETGAISVSEDGELVTGLDPADFRRRLAEALSTKLQTAPEGELAGA